VFGCLVKASYFYRGLFIAYSLPIWELCFNFVIMPTISNMSFNVKFDLDGIPTLVLTDTTTSPPAGLVGIFEIIQPDGYVRTGNINSPDIPSAGSSFSYTLMLDSTGQVQRGSYTIKYTAAAPGYLSTDFTRTFQFQYLPVTLNLNEQFDVFTPKLEYIDSTNYQVANYNNTAVTRSWTAVSTPTGTITGSTATFDVKFSNQYWDANYVITLTSSLVYTHQTYAWLTVEETITKSVNTYAETPATLAQITSLIVLLKNTLESQVDTVSEFAQTREDFTYAQSLFEHIIYRIRLNNTTSIYRDLKDLIAVLRNYQIPTYVPLNAPIGPYNLTPLYPGAAWGNITGTITNQTDLVNYIASQISGGKYATSIGDGVNLTYTVTHNLNNLDVDVEVVENATGETVFTDVSRTGVNTLSVSFATAPTTNQYRVIVNK
jgi:hypothetical protein